MTDLTTRPTSALDAMKRRLTNWLVGIVALDLVLLTGFAVVLITKSPQHALPLAPLLTLPALALLPVLRQLGAVKREMARRGTAAPQQ